MTIKRLLLITVFAGITGALSAMNTIADEKAHQAILEKLGKDELVLDQIINYGGKEYKLVSFEKGSGGFCKYQLKRALISDSFYLMDDCHWANDVITFQGSPTSQYNACTYYDRHYKWNRIAGQALLLGTVIGFWWKVSYWLSGVAAQS